MRRDYGKLLDSVEWEGRILSKAELEEIAYNLQLEGNQINPYQMLRLLGLGGNTKYRSLVERFLYFPPDPLVSALALRILFEWWGGHHTYLEILKEFLREKDWDPNKSTRFTAISIAGEYLRQHHDTVILSMLLEIFANESESLIVRSAVYSALARVVGKEWNEIPSVGNKPIDPQIIQQVRGLTHGQRRRRLVNH